MIKKNFLSKIKNTYKRNVTQHAKEEIWEGIYSCVLPTLGLSSFNFQIEEWFIDLAARFFSPKYDHMTIHFVWFMNLLSIQTLQLLINIIRCTLDHFINFKSSNLNNRFAQSSLCLQPLYLNQLQHEQTHQCYYFVSSTELRLYFKIETI